MVGIGRVEVDEAAFRRTVLDTARAHVRRFGQTKTTVLDIAKAMGASHTKVYRHFASKAEILDALVEEEMAEEIDAARAIAARAESASERLEAMVLQLHRMKLARFAGDGEVFDLYKYVMAERPAMVADYAKAMTEILAAIIKSGIASGEFRIKDAARAADAIRSAATVFVHPAMVAAHKDLPMERYAVDAVRIIAAGMRSGNAAL
jgi:AcrR family transcriptional regulator